MPLLNFEVGVLPPTNSGIILLSSYIHCIYLKKAFSNAFFPYSFTFFTCSETGIVILITLVYILSLEHL